MRTWRVNIRSYKSISWVIIAAILMVTLLPVHYHMHHAVDAESSHHEHVADLHLTAQPADSKHHTDDLHNITFTPEGVVKKNPNPAFSPIILLTFLLSFLSLFRFIIGIRHGNRTTGLKQNFYHFIPPLRAPPAL